MFKLSEKAFSIFSSIVKVCGVCLGCVLGHLLFQGSGDAGDSGPAAS